MAESMAVEWEKWLETEKSNIEALEKRIQGLATGFEHAEGFRFREFWAEADAISQMFETLAPLPQDDRERLQAEYDRVCGETKRKQAEERKKRERDWHVRRVQSRKIQQLIEGKVQAALDRAESAPDDMAALAEAQSLLTEALGVLKNIQGKPESAGEAAAVSPESQKGGDMLREDRQACWEKWRAANDLIFSRRQAIWERSYGLVKPEADAALAEANDGDPFQALQKVKQAQSHFKESQLSKSQREEVKTILNSAWDVAIAKANKIREEKRTRHEKWLGRMESNIGGWTNSLQKNKEEITELEEQIKRLQAEIRSARSPDHAAALRDWIKQKRLQIAEIEKGRTDLEDRIKFAREKLSSKPAEKEAKPVGVAKEDTAADQQEKAAVPDGSDQSSVVSQPEQSAVDASV